MKYLYNLNTNDKRRNEIVKEYIKQKTPDLIYFAGLPLHKLELLFEEDFIDPDQSQSGFPTNQEFYDFIKENPDFTCHGFMVSKDRTDYRITIEGVAFDGKVDIDLIKRFIEFRCADEFDINEDSLYCWYD